MWVADDLGAWLVAVLADAGRRKLTALVLGDELDRALGQAATAAVQATARELRPGDAKQAGYLARVISEVFAAAAPPGGHGTVLGALQAGIASQLAVLEDREVTGIGRSSAEVLEIPAGVLAPRLTGHLLDQIVFRGARGGPLFPLASQLNADVTRLQSQQTQDVLRQLGADILGAIARISQPVPVAAPVALSQLPAILGGFTGRDADMELLAGLLDPAGPFGAVVVSAVAGLAGVGKTALAVQAGHAARARGWFGGGVLFIDLHGYEDQPVLPAQALDALLRALGVPAEHIPPGVEERAGLYRSALAQASEPVLVIADNASAESQIRLLLPGHGPHRMIVTSRHTLAGLGARLLDVTVLEADTSVALLDAALRVGRPDDDRISADSAAAGTLAAICGGLPLALQVVAAILKTDPVLGASELAGELAGEKDRLAALRYDDDDGAGGQSVEAAFGLSNARLDETSARVFRLLPVNPGPDVSTAAAAVLAGIPDGKVGGVLRNLARAHLIAAAPGAARRWQMHDLVRLYAQRLSEVNAEADGREQALDRLLSHYLHLADAADDHLHALPPGKGVAPGFADRADALAWLDVERSSLVAAVSVAAATGRDQIAMRLPNELAEYLGWRRRFDELLAVTGISLEAARRVKDRHREGMALRNLGISLCEVGRFGEAITACRAAAAIYREAGDRHGEGGALINLGSALLDVGSYDESITMLEEAATIFRETGDRNGEGKALGNIGLALREVGRFDEAITALRQDLAICRETGDWLGEGGALSNFGEALCEVGRFDEAITACQAAAAICRDAGDRHGEGMALGNFGLALRGARRFDEAIAAHQDAIAAFRETGDRHHEDRALEDLAGTEAARDA